MPEEFIKVAEVGELKPGKMRRVRMGSQRILLCNYRGSIYAVANSCTHEDGLLDKGLFYEHEIVCPLHGASFDVRTGEVVTPPAMQELTVYQVKVEGNDILIGHPSE